MVFKPFSHARYKISGKPVHKEALMRIQSDCIEKMDYTKRWTLTK